MITPIFKGTCKKGKPVLADSEKWFLHLCTLDGKECEFIARKKSKRKTNKENKYFRGIVVPLIAQHCGYTNDKAFGVLQQKFFLYEDEKGVKYIKSTKLDVWNTIYWEGKMSEIRQWASEFLHIYIPKPNETDYY